MLVYILFLSLFCSTFAFTVKSIDPPLSCHLDAKPGNKKFPVNFSFGVSTAAYQIEGGWNADGKGPSIWDTFTHQHAEMISDHTNADVSADSYYRFEQDLAALVELKVQFYRFSISWPRILPNADISSRNQKGIDYYNMMINKLIANGIEPMITMYHYDMPTWLHNFGGFTNVLFIKYFELYADLLFKEFGDRVKLWNTFNEPKYYCVPGYGTAIYPPLVKGNGILDYLCAHITLKAHAKAYRLYRHKYYAQQKGKLGITINTGFYFPKTAKEVEFAERAMQYSLGWLAHPIYSSSGNYPDVMIAEIANNSRSERRNWSRLPTFSNHWLGMLKGSADFLGINHYTSRLTEPKDDLSLWTEPSWEYDTRWKLSIPDNRKHGKSSWLYCVPEGLEALLNWIRLHYNNIEVIITENGWSDDGELNDENRIDFLRSHLQAVLNAVNNGCNVSRYSYWSLIDNFEWLKGYTEKFGLYHVNMSSEHKERIPKKSASYYRSVIQSRSIPT